MDRIAARVLGVLGGFLFVGVSIVGCSTAIGTPDVDSQSDESALGPEAAPKTKSVCQGSRFRCFAQVHVNANGEQRVFAGPTGLGATDIADAYKLDTSIDPHATVAITDAYGYPNAERDLSVYRRQYGLPPCTVANGCLTIVNQHGETSPLPPPPPANEDWTTEAALDLDMASAACPKCKLLLVLADDSQGDGLFVSQTTAARLGATVISDSWGTSETATDLATQYEHFFALPTTAGIFVASGDSGYNNGGQGPDYPGTSAYVTSVGGTKLTRASGGRGWKEVAWSSSFFGGGAGSSCGLSVPKPAWQGNTACSFKASADVSAVADPASGPAVYHGGWTAVGGTSAASPIVAAIYALTGHGKDAPSFAYKHTDAFFDVTSGSNGSCGNVLCNSGVGWDGPTGFGTPNGAKLKAAACTASCTGKTCGNDGCGGSCGSCRGTDFCNGAGACVHACVPSCSGKVCGSDGCGGSCGTCPSGKICGANNQCSTCTPSCQAGTCGGNDGCGGTCTCPNGGSCLFGICL